MEVNPKEQLPEYYIFNNFLQSQIYVEKDNRNPLLDVTFDGVHIMNNDIVSSKPNIVIELRDDNPYLALTDTALFKISVEYPDGTVKPLFLNDPSLRFTPASANNKTNKATLEYRPTFAKDGIYHLIVKAKDASNNSAGSVDYRIGFKVVTYSSLSNILPYPNPFSTATRFVYTLTGDALPSKFTIQIMTISGKVVREITQNEIGPLKIGTHMTDYVWDGRDEFNDPLANGVYLYKVIAKDATGKAFQEFDNNTNQYFKKGIGKLVIMR